MKLSAENYRDNTTSIREAVASLISCLTTEIPNEARILRATLERTAGDEMRRLDPKQIERRQQMIERAEQMLEARESIYAAKVRAGIVKEAVVA